ncbi:Unannotated, partial [Lentimonas sp. CC4]
GYYYKNMENWTDPFVPLSLLVRKK